MMYIYVRDISPYKIPQDYILFFTNTPKPEVKVCTAIMLSVYIQQQREHLKNCNIISRFQNYKVRMSLTP